MKRLLILATLLILTACTAATVEPVTPTAAPSDTPPPTSTSTATTTPTIMPTATNILPTPDFLQLPFANNILFASAANPDCQLPCWQGLRVGKSTDKDVQRIFDEVFEFNGTIDFFSTNQYISRAWYVDNPGLYTTGYSWGFPPNGESGFTFIAVTDITTGILQGIQFNNHPGSQFMSHTPQQIIREVGTPDYILAEATVDATGTVAGVRLRLIYKDGMNFGYGKNFKNIEDSQADGGIIFPDFCLNEQPTSGIDYITLPFESLEETGTNTLHQIWLVDYLKRVPLEPIEDVFGVTIEEFVEIALQDDPCIEINQDTLLEQ